MDPITIAAMVAKFAPTLVGWIAGDDAEEKAAKVADVVTKVTGISDPQSAIAAIEQDPALALELQKQIMAAQVEHAREETKRLQAVNETMRAEYASGDKYVARWRPTFGYVVSLTWLLQMGALSAIIVMDTAAAPAIITAMAGLSTMWGVALAILGISVHKRSQDKQVKAGHAPAPGLLATLLKR